MKAIHSLMAVGILMLVAFGCKKDPLDHMTVDESRIYITDHDSTLNFGSFKTFSVSDSVARIENGEASMQLNDADVAYISAVKQEMKSRGFTQVSKDADPDLGLVVNRIISTSTGVISYGSYWDRYSYYWDPYYWGYPGYGYYLPYQYAVYQLREGAVSVDMVDLKNANTNKKLNVVWTGLIRGTGIYNADVAASQVKALFDQSPYLKTN